jgi:hypothetical protein
MQTHSHSERTSPKTYLADRNSPSVRHDYLDFCRRANRTARQGGTVQISWSSKLLDAAGWRRAFISALFRRIDDKAGIEHSGRKHSDQYQTGLMRDAYRLRDIRNRIRVYQFETPELTRRFGHLLARHDD